MYKQKKILIIVPYDNIYPPMNGGMQRCFNIIHQLAKHFHLTVIINQKKEDFLRSMPEFPAIENATVYSTQDAEKPKDIFNVFPGKIQNGLRFRWYKKKIKGSADGNFLKYYPVVSQLLKQEKFDAIILENLGTLNAVSLIRKYDKKVKIIYDAHNVDTNLAASFLEINEISRNYFKAIRKAESNLYKAVDAIFTCSKKDKDDFIKLNEGRLKVSVIPNGVNLHFGLCDEAAKSDDPKYILFCGSLSSPPNSEGLLWFYNSIWPTVKEKFPQLQLLIVGSGHLPSSMELLFQDKSLVFTGAVNDVKKYYNQSAISIVPLKTGSGTRLKILEAMSFGLPVISTSKGAEGIEYTDGNDILIADEENIFAKEIIRLLQCKQPRLILQRNARKLVEEKYDWDIIGEKLSDFISNG